MAQFRTHYTIESLLGLPQLALPHSPNSGLAVLMAPVPELKESLVNGTAAKDVENGEKPDDSAHEEVFLYRLPFSSQSYFMMRPVENVHIYVWIIKDLSWSQDWYYPTLIFGALALLWCGMLLMEAIRTRSVYEVYMITGTTLWLAANYTWMAGNYRWIPLFDRCLDDAWRNF